MDKDDKYAIYVDIANDIINNEINEKYSKIELVDDNIIDNIGMHIKEFEIKGQKNRWEFIEHIIELALHTLAIKHNKEFNLILNNLINPYEYNKRLKKEEND